MLRFLLRKLAQGLLVLWGIVSLLFGIFYALGDPTAYLVGDNADEATRQAIRTKYGLDRPVYVQYVRYLNGLSPLGLQAHDATGGLVLLPLGAQTLALKTPDLGISYQSNSPVRSLVAGRVEGTLILALAAICLAAGLGIALGLVAALRYDTFWDGAILSLSVLGISAPSFFTGVLIVWLFAVQWRDWTGLHASGYLFEDDIFGPGRRLVLHHLLLPALALGIRPLAVFIQLTRSSMIEVLQASYIRTAHAKGLSAIQVLLRHALRNALNPVATSISGWLASLLAGAFFIEYIFNWQGVGKLTIDAVLANDFPLIIGCALFIGLVFIAVSILTDLLYAVLDPRVKL
ncbi:MAG: ABC transporter permease [Bacteroidia bacterium]